MSRPRSVEKRDNIKKSASAIFLKMGYTNASMDLIAQMAGVSKQTIYSHFGSKEELFMSILQDKCEDKNAALDPIASASKSVEMVLAEMGASFVDFICSPERMALFRLVIAEGAANKKLASLFWKNGPGLTTKELGAFFKHRIIKGELRNEDPEFMAEQFIHVVSGHFFMLSLLNITTRPTEAQREKQVTRAVKAFLMAYKV